MANAPGTIEAACNTQRLELEKQLLDNCNSVRDQQFNELLDNRKEDNELFVNADNKSTDLLKGIIKDTESQLISELQLDYPTIDDLEAATKNPIEINRIIRSYEKTLVQLIFHMRYVNAVENGGNDNLMDGFINDTITIGQNKVKNEKRKAIAEAKESGNPLSVLFLDIDKFGKVNKQFCEKPVGDMTLTYAAKCISKVARDSINIRVGGEEIALILKNADASGACIVAERIREYTDNHPFYMVYDIDGIDHEGKDVVSNPRPIDKAEYNQLIKENEILDIQDERGVKTTIKDKRNKSKTGQVAVLKIPLTFSIGVAQCHDLTDADSITKFQERANMQMRSAKENGRNRIYCDGKHFVSESQSTEAPAVAI